MRKIILTFGLIAGAILSAMMLLTIPFEERIGYGNGLIVGYATMVAAFLMVFFGIRSYRDTEGAGRVSFGRAFAIGVSITLVASVCYVATWELIYFKLAPGFVDKYAIYSIDKARRSGATDAQIAVRTREMDEFRKAYDDPLFNIAMTFVEPLPVGLLFSLVAAAALSRRRRPVAAIA